jgi:2-polyprenyl-3-methyl-5-hydroxy-6-metoxy-1,4-benzoquinol methylase
MNYDPIKERVSAVFETTPALQKLFYRLLDLLLLRAWHIQRELKQWGTLNQGAKQILDAGSGFGQYTYFMARRFPDAQILGVDVKEEEVANSRKFFEKVGMDHVRFETADLTTFQHPDTYDLVLSVDVMEHIEPDVQVFRNICHSLKPGGMLLISTPSDQGGSDVQSEEDESFIGEHVRDGYGIREIKDKLYEAGFSRVKARYSYGAPGKVSWRLSMKYPILMLNWSKAMFAVLPFYYLVVYPFCFILNYIDSNTGHMTGTGLIVKAWR